MKTRSATAVLSILAAGFAFAQNVREEPQSDPVLDAIQEFVERFGYAPTVRELAGGLGCGHSTVQKALFDLVDEGKIKRVPGVARGIVVAGGVK